MKAKEKADELWHTIYNSNQDIETWQATDLSNIFVDIMIKEYDQNSYYQSQFDRLEFWKQVKQEINNL